jgi:membrane-associated phospholipid phosphatase
MLGAGWEEAVVRWANGFAGRSAALDTVMAQLSHGWWPFLLVAIAVAYWLWRERRRGLYEFATLAVGIGLADFIGSRIKHLVGRPRPCSTLEGLHPIAGCGEAFSMPSNHVLNLAVAAGFLQVLYPRSGWILWPLLAIQAFSRLYVGAHYPTDALAGAVLGVAIGAALGIGFRRAVRRERPRAGQPAPDPRAGDVGHA